MFFSVAMFWEPCVSRSARILDRQACRFGEWEWKDGLDRMSARSFLPFQPRVQVGCAETPQFTDMGAVNLPASSQLL
jgi:hypothetical protein